MALEQRSERDDNGIVVALVQMLALCGVIIAYEYWRQAAKSCS